MISMDFYIEIVTSVWLWALLKCLGLHNLCFVCFYLFHLHYYARRSVRKYLYGSSFIIAHIGCM